MGILKKVITKNIMRISGRLSVFLCSNNRFDNVLLEIAGIHKIKGLSTNSFFSKNIHLETILIIQYLSMVYIF